MDDAGASEAAQVADALHERLVRLLAPLLGPLDRQIDRRLVRTFVGTVEAIVCFRNRPRVSRLAAGSWQACLGSPTALSMRADTAW
jgi:hypothetical protein